MKNCIISLLAVVCVCLLLNALGVFQFGSFIDRGHRSWNERMREKSVRKSPVLKLGAAYDAADRPAVEAMEGVSLAAELLNQDGGVNGRKLEIIRRDDVKTLPEYCMAIQQFCDDPAIAAVIGPFSSGYIPSARALTQFHGLPLISPLTVRSEKLPQLEPDNFVTLFPPLKLWIDAILAHMEKKGHRNILIVSPETDTYGDIFCTALERESRHRAGFGSVYRLNYQSPLRRRDLLHAVQNYAGDRNFDAVFFGGTFSDFPEFLALLKERRLTVPVYGSDDLYIPQIRSAAAESVLCLPRVELRRKDTRFVKEWIRRFGREPSYHTVLGAESVFAVAEAVRSAGDGAFGKLPEILRESRTKLLRDPQTAPRIVMDCFAPSANKK